MNFSSCSDHSWIINDCYIFFPYLRVWVFLFLRTFLYSTIRLSYGTQFLNYHINYNNCFGMSCLFLLKHSWYLWRHCGCLKRFTFSQKISLFQPCLLACDFACLLLEISIQLFFFPFLFSSYPCSIASCYQLSGVKNSQRVQIMKQFCTERV